MPACGMNDLYDHICRKCPHGIPYSEAVKLMLTLYCTLAILPKEFQNLPLSKIECKRPAKRQWRWA